MQRLVHGGVLGAAHGARHRLGRHPRHHAAHPRQHDRDGRARAHAGVRRAPRDRLRAAARRASSSSARRPSLGLVGGAVGVGIAYPFVNKAWSAAAIEENMGALFPYFRVEPSAAVARVRHRDRARARRGRSFPSIQAGRVVGHRRAPAGGLRQPMVPIKYNVRSLIVRKTTTAAAAFGLALVVFVFAVRADARQRHQEDARPRRGARRRDRPAQGLGHRDDERASRTSRSNLVLAQAAQVGASKKPHRRRRGPRRRPPGQGRRRTASPTCTCAACPTTRFAFRPDARRSSRAARRTRAATRSSSAAASAAASRA